MVATTWHCHIAVSLDGKIARPDGGVEDWLAADYPAEAFGFDAFYAGVDAILMGRGSYDAVRRMGEWSYAGKPVVVATSRPLGNAPEGVRAGSGDLAAITAGMAAQGHRRVWVFGGGQLLRGMIAIGRLDVLELAVIPVILGEGIPLFPAGTPGMALRLARCEAKAKGALHLVYERAA